MKEKIIVALDKPNLKEAGKLVKDLSGMISYFKIGLELFTACGWDAVKLVKESGSRVFLDLKLHDIPNTVARTAKVICDHQVDMFNVHTLGGVEMMKRMMQVVKDSSPKEKCPVVLGVTILTSHSSNEFDDLIDSKRHCEEDAQVPTKQSQPGLLRPFPPRQSRGRIRPSADGARNDITDYVLHLATLAKESGLHGVVCSPQEIQPVREKLGKDFVLVTPGIRARDISPGGKNLDPSVQDDQKRIMTPKEALEAGADYLVIGRPITQASGPRQAAEDICNNLHS